MNRYEIRRQMESIQPPIAINHLVLTILQKLSDKKVFTDEEVMHILTDAHNMTM